MKEIIQEMTGSCPRADCEIISRGLSIARTGSSSSQWHCRSCFREWSVTNYEPGPITYNKRGEPSQSPGMPPRVIEIASQKSAK